jgi:hypothetical protein
MSIVGVERFFTKSRGGIQTFCRIDFWKCGAIWHWINGNDEVIPFGTKDNGGDLVETSFFARDC